MRKRLLIILCLFSILILACEKEEEKFNEVFEKDNDEVKIELTKKMPGTFEVLDAYLKIENHESKSTYFKILNNQDRIIKFSSNNKSLLNGETINLDDMIISRTDIKDNNCNMNIHNSPLEISDGNIGVLKIKFALYCDEKVNSYLKIEFNNNDLILAIEN